MLKNFTTITELPAGTLNAEQMARMIQRYQVGALLGADKDVLEVACGAGLGLGVLHHYARTVVACDYTGAVLRVAQRHYGQRLPLVAADAEQLPFISHAFDLILAFEAIYYLQQLDWFLAEAQRLLRSHGTLLLCTSNPDWPHFVAGAMSVHYPSLPELAAQLTLAGFQQPQFYGAFPTPTHRPFYKTWLAQVRKYALQQKVFTTDSILTRHLKQLAYGRLIPLPAELTLTSLPSSYAAAGLTALSPSVPDTTHRVLFAMAQRG
ncbi:MAG: class I SAM-dependent methyltransferase [Caldilineaceae bacterium]|nr:class I SAM-dependent methyltransferase [Caldilineaceae bacterium]